MSRGMLALLAAALVAIAVGVPTLAGGEPAAERSVKVKRVARNALTALKTANAALTAAAQGWEPRTTRSRARNAFRFSHHRARPSDR